MRWVRWLEHVVAVFGLVTGVGLIALWARLTWKEHQ
jgi:hypothetical protein